ncbi:MAG: hypothetical protein R2862_12830 [Thermoanaerobaculia bacterium]
MTRERAARWLPFQSSRTWVAWNVARDRVHQGIDAEQLDRRTGRRRIGVLGAQVDS